ncbi:Alkyltransferase-like protein 1 [Penicillium rolfsii]|nr:Alkyltransferase-like protein 1 [Penicillium rolfsii]
MPRSEEAEWWANAVYAAIQEIPHGKVTSYGHIALLLGERTDAWNTIAQRPRQVGVCLKSLPTAETGSHFHSGNVPWQRVINAKGMISHRGPGSAERQAEALIQEGVEVTRDSMGEIYVDFSRYGWFPKMLPSEEEAEDDAQLFVQGS